jgi:cytochrome P450
MLRLLKLPFLPTRFLGENVVASEGEVWKRHRRITAPAFTQSAYEHVWKVTAGVYADINEKDAWLGRDVVDVTDINKLTHKVRSHCTGTYARKP